MKLFISTHKENIDSCLQSINHDLDRIDSLANGLSINPSKFKYIMPMFRLFYLDCVLKEIKLTLSGLQPIWILYLITDYRGLPTYNLWMIQLLLQFVCNLLKLIYFLCNCISVKFLQIATVITRNSPCRRTI